MIADSLRRFIFQKTEKKITVQRLLYQGVNKCYISQKLESYAWGNTICNI